MSFDGIEKRKTSMNDGDHDLLQQIANDLKHVVKWVEKHDLDDTKRFDKVEKEMEFGKRILYGGVGIIVFVEFVFKFIK